MDSQDNLLSIYGNDHPRPRIEHNGKLNIGPKRWNEWDSTINLVTSLTDPANEIKMQAVPDSANDYLSWMTSEEI